MRIMLACLAWFASSTLLCAQTASEAVQNMAGAWELSNSERDKLCNLTFRTDAARSGYKLDFDPACATTIPALKGVEGWTLNNETLRLVDSRGRVMLEMSEVEVGMYEGERKDEGLYFLQTAASAAVFAPKHAVEQMVGDWSLTRGEKRVCDLTLTAQQTKGFDEYVMTVKSPCDAAFTRLNPTVGGSTAANWC